MRYLHFWNLFVHWLGCILFQAHRTKIWLLFAFQFFTLCVQLQPLGQLDLVVLVLYLRGIFNAAWFLTWLPVVNWKYDWMLVYGFIWQFVAIVYIVVMFVFNLTVHPDILWMIFVVVFVWWYPKDVLGHIEHTFGFLNLILSFFHGRGFLATFSQLIGEVP